MRETGTCPTRRHGSEASASEKIALVRRLFHGREDVFALRWENSRTGKSGYAPATAEGWTRHGPKTYSAVDDEAIERHLRGRESIGIYPLLQDDSCWFLACDFDGTTWQLDALAVLEAARNTGCRRPRAKPFGEGGHVWIFFSAPVAATARHDGSGHCCCARR